MNSAAQQVEPQTRHGFRDELNFAEFPLASLSSTLPKGQKTLEFSDEIFDKSRNERVVRKLTITASDKFGLPTAMDDEVILGLVQLTAQQDFTQRRVHFTRYELLKILNWSDDTRNYRRLEQSLNRWLGVTLYYDKAWWSKEEQCWVNEGFHILDHVQVFDSERQRRARQRGGESDGKSSFLWNEVVFNSFKSGYLKQIDFEFYKGLESAISKRMYRFLDKRFYHRQRLEFDLRVFACEHIGVSKNYHNGELKRVLTPAIKELEVQGYLKPLAADARFVRNGRGDWAIVFVKSSAQIEHQPEAPEAVNELVKRGVKLASALAVWRQAGDAAVRERIALFDWLMAKKDPRVQKSPAGFLYQSIAENYPLPDDYRAATSVRAKGPERKVLAKESKPVESVQVSDRTGIDEFWNSLPAERRDAIEKELVAAAPRFLREQYMQGQQDGGLLFRTVRQSLIDGYVRGEIQAKG
jgi:hypothetical protein